MATHCVDRDHAQGWIARYERAWRTAGTDSLRDLFAEDATYSVAPFEPPIVGYAAIAEMWEAERHGPDERFTMDSELVSVDGRVAVARIAVRYESPAAEYRAIWIIHFAGDGRCQAFEEWPFFPGQPWKA